MLVLSGPNGKLLNSEAGWNVKLRPNELAVFCFFPDRGELS